MTLYTSKASPALRPARAQGPYTASAVARSTEGEHLGAPLRGRAREDRPGSPLRVRAREDRPDEDRPDRPYGCEPVGAPRRVGVPAPEPKAS